MVKKRVEYLYSVSAFFEDNFTYYTRQERLARQQQEVFYAQAKENKLPKVSATGKAN